MIDKKAARAGGMPLYKWIGNQILTAFQNRMLGTQLLRIPLRLPALFDQGAGPDSVREKHERFPFRHRDHHSVRPEKSAHRGAADPDLITATKSATSTG